MESMQGPNTRAEFERNFYLYHHQIEAGLVGFTPNVVHTLEGLARVRVLPNGRVDFLSVDETARLQVNMMANMLARPEPTLPEGQSETDAKSEPSAKQPE